MLRKSDVCAIDFPIRRPDPAPCFGGVVRTGAAFETVDNSGGIFYFESAVTH
jgi:hypothetical protein